MALISDPCIAQYDFQKRPFILTDFSKLGFGYDLRQPNDDPDSLATMNREMAGGDCEFLQPQSKLLLRALRALTLAKPTAGKPIFTPIWEKASPLTR